MAKNNFSNCTNAMAEYHPLIITTDLTAKLYNYMIDQHDYDFGPYKEKFVLIARPDADVCIGLQEKEADFLSELKNRNNEELGEVSVRLLGGYGLDWENRVTDRLFVVIDEDTVRNDGHSVRIVQWQYESDGPEGVPVPARWLTARIEWEWALQWLACLSYKLLAESKADHGDNDILKF